jgi:hypothetical protein
LDIRAKSGKKKDDLPGDREDAAGRGVDGRGEEEILREGVES